MSMTDFEVSQAEAADIEVVAPLFDAYRQFYGKESNLELARAFIRERLELRESAILLARNHQGEVLGFTQLYPSFSSVGACRIWVLNDLFVRPSSRGLRVGSALLNAAKAHAIASGAGRIDLSTAHDNPAQKLYESHGYLRDADFYHYSLSLPQP